MGIEEGEEVQVKGIHNIFKVTAGNFPNLKKELSESCTGSLLDTKQT
jgi:hypothetical protein